MIKEDTTLILDSGTTTLEVAKLLKTREDLTIVTNDIKIAAELTDSANKVIVTGGEVQRDVGALFGTATQDMLKVIHADLFFLGAHAINLENGVTAPTFEKSVIKQMMMKAAKTTWLLADHSKFNQIAFSKVCELNKLEGIVTDSTLDPDTISAYEQHIPIMIGGDAP